MDQETVKITALNAIFDLLLFFGLEAFKLEMTTPDDNDKTSTAAETDEDSTREKQSDRSGDDQLDDDNDDFDDLHSEASSQPLQQQQETTDIGADILTILTDLLDSNVSRVLQNFSYVYIVTYLFLYLPIYFFIDYEMTWKVHVKRRKNSSQ